MKAHNRQQDTIAFLANAGAVDAKTAIASKEIKIPEAGRYAGGNAAGYLATHKKGLLNREWREFQYYYWLAAPLKDIEAKLNGGRAPSQRKPRTQAAVPATEVYELSITGPDTLIERKLDKRALSKILTVIIV